jgi:hypothetical protein
MWGLLTACWKICALGSATASRTSASVASGRTMRYWRSAACCDSFRKPASSVWYFWMVALSRRSVLPTWLAFIEMLAWGLLLMRLTRSTRLRYTVMMSALSLSISLEGMSGRASDWRKTRSRSSSCLSRSSMARLIWVHWPRMSSLPLRSLNSPSSTSCSPVLG